MPTSTDKLRSKRRIQRQSLQPVKTKSLQKFKMYLKNTQKTYTGYKYFPLYRRHIESQDCVLVWKSLAGIFSFASTTTEKKRIFNKYCEYAHRKLFYFNLSKIQINQMLYFWTLTPIFQFLNAVCLFNTT